MALAILLATAPSPAPAPEADIVVLGRRLQEVTFRLDIAPDGHLRSCKIQHSSGDKELDRFWCEEGAACSYTHVSNKAAIEECLRAKKSEFLDRLVASRAAAAERIEAHAAH